MIPDTAQPTGSPARAFVATPATAVAEARGSRPDTSHDSVGAPVGGSPPAASAAPTFALPAPEPPALVAVQAAAPTPGGGGRSEPVALSDWIGSGPPLPPVFVYLAVFASGLAIIVSMRRELGLHPRRRRRF